MSLFRYFENKDSPEQPSLPDNERILSAASAVYSSSYQVNPVPYLNDAGINTLADLKALLDSECANNFKRRKLERKREQLSEQLNEINSTLEAL